MPIGIRPNPSLSLHLSLPLRDEHEEVWDSFGRIDSPAERSRRRHLGAAHVHRPRRSGATETAQHSVPGRKRAAEREMARLVTEQERSPAAIPQEEARAWGSSTTINQAIEGWKEDGWADLSPKTVRGYEEIWERYVRETIGPKRIAALNAFEVERYYRDLKDQGAGRDTVRRVRVVIGRACRLAGCEMERGHTDQSGGRHRAPQLADVRTARPRSCA